MPQYLVATYHPDNYDPSIETEAMSHKKRGDCSQLFPAGADPCRRLGRIPETRASYKKALALARQERERRFLARRLEEFK